MDRKTFVGGKHLGRKTFVGGKHLGRKTFVGGKHLGIKTLLGESIWTEKLLLEESIWAEKLLLEESIWTEKLLLEESIWTEKLLLEESIWTENGQTLGAGVEGQGAFDGRSAGKVHVAVGRAAVDGDGLGGGDVPLEVDVAGDVEAHRAGPFDQGGSTDQLDRAPRLAASGEVNTLARASRG